MKRLVITTALMIAVTGVAALPVSAAVSPTQVADTTNTQVASLLGTPLMQIINDLTNQQADAATTTAAPSTTAQSNVAAQNSSSQSSAIKTTTTEAAPTATVTIPAVTNTSFLSATPTERISSYTYPSSKLSPELTLRLNILAGVIGVTGLLFVLGLYEGVVRATNYLGTLFGRRTSTEEIR